MAHLNSIPLATHKCRETMAKIDLKLVTELRNKTGLGLMDCKKALVEAKGNIEKALEILRKKGAKIAAKRASKETSEGVIEAYIHPGSRIGALIELNCETDFVARTEDLKGLARNLCIQIAAMNPLYVAPENVSQEFLEKEKEIMKDMMKESGKPENVIDKIVEGKLSKLYEEICLLDQAFVKDDKKTVRQAIEEVMGRVGENIKVKRFCRFALGQ